MPASLEISPPTPSLQRSRLLRVLVIALAVVLAVAWLAWYLLTPEDLPVSDQEVQATGVVGTPLYVGMFRAPEDFGRSLHVRSVAIEAMAGDGIDLEITPLLCRNGSIGNTTDPGVFCDDLVAAEGQDLEPGDSIAVEVEVDAATVVLIERIEIAFRDGVVSGTKPAGLRRATLAFVAQES